MLDKLTHESFTPHVNDTFDLKRDDGEDLGLELVEATPMGSPPKGDRRHSFSVLFHCPEEQPLPQQTYAVEHGEMGELELFLVPVGPDEEKKGMLYEAVFT